MKRGISGRRILAISTKEIRHVLRDPFTLAVALGIPVLLVTVFGFAIDFDIRNLKLTIFDSDHSYSSRALSQTFSNSGYFKTKNSELTDDPVKELTGERASSVLVIPKNFERDLGRDSGSKAQIIVDGTDNSTIGPIMGYLSGITNSAARKIFGDNQPERLRIESRYEFNSGLKTNWFIVPGLSAVVLAILSILLTSLTISKEWEVGSMELLLSTPVRPAEIIMGKIAPYLLLGIIGAAFVYVSARLIFGIPFRGSHFLLVIGSVLFLSTYLSLGLIISVTLRKQQLATQASILMGLLPSLLLSGFIFSRENMPAFWQYFTAIFPATWFMIISRALYLKGTGFLALAKPFAVLFGMSFVLIVVAIKKFKGDLES
jgi:ABC-2 type transport system permease protein